MALENTLTNIRDSFSDANTAITTTPTPDTTNTYPTLTQEQYNAAGAAIRDASNFQNNKTTVAGQLSSLLNSDSAYMKQVDAKSKMTANQLGMLSSDRYIGASTGAAIREGLPIAQQDAETAKAFGLQQQQGETSLANVKTEGMVSGALNSQKYRLENQSAQYKSQLDNYQKQALTEADVSTKDFQSELQESAVAKEYGLKEKLAATQNALDTKLMQAEYTQQTKENTRAQASDLIKTTSINIEEMLRDPDILQLGSSAVASLVNNQIKLTNAGVELIYNTAGLNLDGHISQLLDSFEGAYSFSGSGLPPADAAIGTKNTVTTVVNGGTTTTTTLNTPVYR